MNVYAYLYSNSLSDTCSVLYLVPRVMYVKCEFNGSTDDKTHSY